jgi:L-ascorbate metabolism protein UlaG (beta-lactamase superfamily)
MRVEWYGQSAFRLSTDGSAVVIDPFGDLSGMADRGLQFDYPQVEDLQADLLLITHEHADHNGVGSVAGEPAILRSTAGQLESPLGQVTAIASEHDEEAGTARGPNTIFVFEFDGKRVCHFGDFGQSDLRPEQIAAIGRVDLLFLPVGGGPTIGGEAARQIVDTLSAGWVVPMHYRTPKINFLETADDFLGRFEHVHRAAGASFDTADLPGVEGPLAVVPEVP